MKIIYLYVGLIVLILLIGVAKADNATFNTTAQFDSGTKTQVETASDTCNLQSAQNQFGINGIGRFIGIQTLCISGTKEFQNQMQSSYDFFTLRTGKLQDFVASADCTISGGPTDAAALYGHGLQFNSSNSSFLNCPNAAPTTSSWSVFYLFKPLVSGSKVIISLDTSVGANFFMAYGMNCNLAADSGVLHACQTNVNDASAAVSINNFHYITWVKNAANSTHNLYVDGLWKSKATSTNGGTTDINICKWVNITTDYCDAVFDELSIWNRVLNDTEVSHLALDGRILFNSVGNWISPIQSLSGLFTFNSVTIVWTPAASGTRYISSVNILDSNGNLIVSNTQLVQSGTSNKYTLGISVSSSWKVQVNLTGDGSGTINPTSVTVDFTNTNVNLFGDIGRVMAFFMILTLMLMGAYWLKKHWGGEE